MPRVRFVVSLLMVIVATTGATAEDERIIDRGEFCESHAEFACSGCGPPSPSCLSECEAYCRLGGECSPEWCVDPLLAEADETAEASKSAGTDLDSRGRKVTTQTAK